MADAIELWLGRAGSGKTTRCFKALAEHAAVHPLERCILLVPDAATYTVERELAAYLPGRGFGNIEVLGFARLAYRIFDEQGTQGGKGLSVLGRQIILRRLLLAHGDEFTTLARAARQPHFTEVFDNQLQELGHYQLEPDDLRRAATEATPALGNKLRDTALLAQAYQEYLAEHFPDYEAQTENLLRAIETSQYLAEASIWVDGFLEFLPRDWTIVEAVMKQAKRAVMTLLLPPEDPLQATAPTSLWHSSWKIYEAAHHAFAKITEIGLTDTLRWPHSQLGLAAEKVTRGEASDAPVAGLRVTEAANRDEETAAVATEIQRLVREEGYRYREIIVLLRHHDAYTERLRRTFERYEIPYFTDRRQAMRHDALAVFVSAALTLAAQGYTTPQVLRLLKTGLLPIATRDVEELEMYCREFAIGRGDWTKEEPWQHRRIRRLEAPEPVTEREQARWDRVNGVRATLKEWLAPLAQVFKTKATVREVALVMYDLLARLPLEAELLTQGENLTEEIYRGRQQVLQRIYALLDEWVEVGGEEVWPARDVARIWTDLLAELSYALIPPTLDHVTFTTIDRGYPLNARAVFVLGQNEGVFPARPQPLSLWSDRDRTELARLDLAFGTDSVTLALQERQWQYLAWTRAEEKLYLSYARADEDGTALEPAFLLRRLVALGWTDSVHPAVSSCPEDGWVRARQSLAGLPQALREESPAEEWFGLYDWAMRQPSHEGAAYAWTRSLFYTNRAAVLGPALSRKLYAPQGTFHASVTAFEMYRACPFRFFARYGLHLDEPARGELTPADYGSYMHAALHQFGAELLTETREFRDADSAEIADRSRVIAELIAPRVQNDRFATNPFYSYIRTQLDRTLRETLTRLAEWSQRGAFQTAGLEEMFTLPVGSIGDTEFTLIGTIDRLDYYRDPETGKTYYLIIDYKTGDTKISLGDLYYGLRLQLATYLYAALRRDDGEALPAGIMYVYVQDERADLKAPPRDDATIRKALKQQLQTQGYFLSEREILEKIDSEVGGEISFLPIRINKDGSLRKDAKAENAAAMRLIVAYIATLLPQISAQILAGRIDMMPYRQGDTVACKYCPYRAVCGFDPALAGNRYRYLPSLNDEEALEKMTATVAKETGDAMDN